MSTLSTPQVPSTPLSPATIKVAEKLVAAHATLPLGELPSKKALVVANEAFKKRWDQIQLSHQIENFFDTPYPHTKEEAEAFLNYAKKTKNGVASVILKGDLENMLPIKIGKPR